MKRNSMEKIKMREAEGIKICKDILLVLQTKRSHGHTCDCDHFGHEPHLASQKSLLFKSC